MADTGTAATMLSGELGNILNFLSAAGGLGTAAMGVVDSTKAFAGGPSNFGFGAIRDGVGPFLGTPPGTAGSKAEVLLTLRANWMNGVAKADQKAKAKALIHLGLTTGSAPALAAAAGVDAQTLQSLATKTANGVAPNQSEISVLGQFDVVVSAALDAAYERGDQIYRNACKLLSMAVATLMGVAGGWLVFGSSATASLWDYFSSSQFGLAVLVGVSATPLAPMAKDLASSLQAAVAAMSRGK